MDNAHEAAALTGDDESSIILIDSSADSDTLEEANQSIPDVIGRPSRRQAATAASEKIAEQIGPKNRNTRNRWHVNID